MTEKGYNLEAGREPAQIAKMQELIDKGLCAFCVENFEEYHDNPIEFQTEHWIVSKNDYPYRGTRLHLLVVPKRHVRMLSDMEAQMRADFAEVLVEIEKRWSLESYALAMRAGDPDLNGGSVEHLHAHVVVGATNKPDHEPVKFKMSSRKPKTGFNKA